MSGTWASGWSVGDVLTAAEYKKGIGAVYDTTVGGGGAASIDISSIVASYAHLAIMLYARGDASSNVGVYLRYNNDSAANYDHQNITANNATLTAVAAVAQTQIQIGNCPGSADTANKFGAIDCWIPHYAGSSNHKHLRSWAHWSSGTAAGNQFLYGFGGTWRSTAAINRVTLLLSSGNFASGTRMTLYALGA